MNDMTLDDAIRLRRSVRGFLPCEVPEETLREVFALAQLAPSNCNVQPWTPHVVSGAPLRALADALVEAARAGLPIDPDWSTAGRFQGIHRDRQYDAAAQLYGAMGVARRDIEGRNAAYLRNHACFDAPHAAFLFLQRPLDTREAVDVGIYAQTLMLAMTSRGLSSCAQGALSIYAGIVRKHLGVGDDHRLLFGISFGYEDPSVKANDARVGRAALDAAVHFHR